MNKTASKNFCPENDYDFYTIPLPLHVLLKRKLKGFIYGELEKLHPCFSDDFAFDSKIAFGKKQLKALVVVMNKEKLASYENQLFVKEMGGKVFFGKKSGVGKTAGLVLLLFLVILFIGIIAGRHKNAAAKNVSVPVSVSENENFITGNLIYESGENLFCFFEEVKKTKGEVKKLLWEVDGFKEKLQVEISRVYPEFLDDFKNSNMTFSTVGFNNGVPEFSVNAVSSLTPKEKMTEQTEDKSITEVQFKRAVRNLITENGFSEESENYKPFTVRFLCSDKSIFFEQIADLCNKAGFVPSKLSLSTTSKNQLQCEIGFIKKDQINTVKVLSLLSGNLEIFGNKEIKNGDILKVKVYAAQKKSSTEKLNYSKVGSVKTPDGKVKVFYKTPEGKIQVRYENE